VLRAHSEQRVRAHTIVRARRAVLGAALGCLGLLALGARAEAAFRDLPARVLWLRDDLVYVGTADSTSLSAEMTLEFSRGKKTLGTARVVRMLDPHVALARLATGSLARERKLDRVAVRGEAAPIVRVGLVRVGLPGRGRVNLLFRCAETGVQARLAGADYGTDSLPGRGLRLRRASAEGWGAAGGPDTIDVRFFSDAADQEIAIERGELDVAVFWPGELSPRMRADPRWRDFERGLRARGVLVGERAPRDTAAIDTRALGVLEREGFSGDLLPWRELEPAAAPGGTRPVTWQVDPAIPGARLLERMLQRGGVSPGATVARLRFLDVPVAASDAVAGAWRAPGVEPLYAIRCPVLVTPRLRSLFAAMGGADAFANLVRCEVGTP
jgi:hypothetical protein